MRIRAHRGRWLAAVGAILAIAGIAALVVGLRAQRSAPQPPASAASPIAVTPVVPPSSPVGSSSSAAPPPTTASAPATRGPILARSTPIRLAIPAIGVTSDIHPLGLLPDGTVQVPPLSKDSYAGWLKYSPTPGQLGPSIVLGHIDSAKYGPGVFFRLGDMRQRDLVSITRADHTVAVFEVERVVEVPKNHFPTLDVYGNTDRAALRLITCGGKFDFSSHNYEDNIIVFASLVSSHHA